MPPKPKLAISACLMGEPCTYRGGHHRLDCLAQLEAAFDLVPLCPETAGGLPVPRDPAEISGGRVMSCAGEDVTDAFVRGAGSCLRMRSMPAARMPFSKARARRADAGASTTGPSRAGSSPATA